MMRKIIILLAVSNLLFTCVESTNAQSAETEKLMREAVLSQEEKKINEALASVNKEISKDPESISMYMNKVHLLLLQKKYEDSIEVLDIVLQKKPEFIEAITTKGIFLEILNKKEQAFEYYRKALVLLQNEIPSAAGSLKDLRSKINIYYMMILLGDEKANAYYSKILDQYGKDNDKAIKAFISDLKELHKLNREDFIKMFSMNQDDS